MSCIQCTDEKGEVQPLYFHSRCHISSVNRVEMGADRLIVRCAECGQLTGEIAIDFPPEIQEKLPGIVACPNHEEQSHWTIYFEGDILVMCNICQRPNLVAPASHGSPVPDPVQSCRSTKAKR